MSEVRKPALRRHPRFRPPAAFRTCRPVPWPAALFDDLSAELSVPRPREEGVVVVGRPASPVAPAEGGRW